MLVIGELINATNKSVGQAIRTRDRLFIENLVREQVAAGADFIDVNAGAGEGVADEARAAMEWLVEVAQEATVKPLAIDSDSPDVIEAGMKKYRGKELIINSVNAEPERLKGIVGLAMERQASVVALAMGKEGIPDNVQDRLAACDIIMKHADRLGMKAEQIFFDPLVLPVSVDSQQGMITLKTLERIKARYPAVRTTMGLSNVSYGLPSRPLVNRTFLVMAVYAGLDSAILNPLDARAMTLIKTATMLRGNDPFCKGYIKAHRKGILTE